MTKEALKIALEVLEEGVQGTRPLGVATLEAITTIKEALMSVPDGAQPERKYCRGDRLICLETDEYCVIHISGTDRQWIKFPDTYIGVYTNEQIAELFELLPKEIEQEPVAWAKIFTQIKADDEPCNEVLALGQMMRDWLQHQVSDNSSCVDTGKGFSEYNLWVMCEGKELLISIKESK